MAVTTKKTTTKKVEDKTVDTKVEEKNSTELENKMLKEQMEKMQAQLDIMAQAFKAMSNKSNEQEETKTKSNRRIRFVNLRNGTVVLKGTSFWTIEGRYNYKDFPEAEARVIVLNMSNYLRSGSVYIDDAQFVRENDLESVYDTLLSDTDLKNLLSRNATDIIETYKNVNDNQKEIIVDMIISDRKAGRDIDNNVLVTIGELSGKNLLEIDD